MAQVVNVIKINESGQTLVDPSVNFAPVLSVFSEWDTSSSAYPFLSTIDEYGDTILNRLQSRVFVEELKKINSKQNTELFNKTLENTINLIESQQPHEYIKFIGD